MKIPLVSVVMPVYNSDKYLKEAIASILSQTYNNLELVIVNDGSTDLSREIICSFSDPRIHFLENEFNSGIVFTRNRGLDAARGEFVATLDSDDIAMPERLEKQVDFLSRNPEYGMCGTFYTTINSEGGFLKKNKFPTDNRDIQTYLTLGNCFCNSTVMIRNKLAKELRYTEKFDIVEDYELWCRIAKRAKLTNLPFYGTQYRVHGNNISVAKMNVMFALVKKINSKILTDLNINYTETELEVHSHWINRNLSYFETDACFNMLETWLYRFYIKLQSEKKYNNRLLYRLIVEKWIVVVFNTGRYGKMFSNRLFRLHWFQYTGIFIKKIIFRLINVE
jgi:glycosyltransferase involved in cell wall biosynthesis